MLGDCREGTVPSQLEDRRGRIKEVSAPKMRSVVSMCYQTGRTKSQTYIPGGVFYQTKQIGVYNLWVIRF